ncbi:MAG: hypothetical protein ABGX16_16535, partial [Pirellulales bacterium]
TSWNIPGWRPVGHTTMAERPFCIEKFSTLAVLPFQFEDLSVLREIKNLSQKSQRAQRKKQDSNELIFMAPRNG